MADELETQRPAQTTGTCRAVRTKSIDDPAVHTIRTLSSHTRVGARTCAVCGAANVMVVQELRHGAPVKAWFYSPHVPPAEPSPTPSPASSVTSLTEPAAFAAGLIRRRVRVTVRGSRATVETHALPRAAHSRDRELLLLERARKLRLVEARGFRRYDTFREDDPFSPGCFRITDFLKSDTRTHPEQN